MNYCMKKIGRNHTIRFGEYERAPAGGRVAKGAYPPERTDNASGVPSGLPQRQTRPLRALSFAHALRFIPLYTGYDRIHWQKPRNIAPPDCGYFFLPF